jgi:DNA-binding NtrC family response regulator
MDTLTADSTTPKPSLADATRAFQQQYIRDTVTAANGNMSEAARRLGILRSAFHRKLRQLGMPTHSAKLCW